MGSDDRVTMPKQVRDYLHLQPGDRFKCFLQPDGAVVLLSKMPVQKLKGSLHKAGRTVSVEEMNAAICSGPTRGRW